MRTTTLTLVLFLSAAQGLSAQMKCGPSETPSVCLSNLIARFQTDAKDNASKELTAEEWQQLTRKATGLNTSDLGLESATEDFLPLLRFAFAAAGLQEGVERSALNFERKIGAFGSDDWELKFKGAVNEAEIFGPLKLAFNEQVREQRAKKLQDELEDLDDYSLALDLNRSSDRFGRTPSDYSQKVFAKLFEEVVRTSPADNRASFALLDILTAEGLTGSETFSQMSAGKSLKIEQAVVAAAQGAVANVSRLKEKANGFSIFQLADLLNNQPQVHVSGGYRLREGAAGPDEFSLKTSYEYAFASLNRFRKKSEDWNCEVDRTDSATFTACYDRFVKEVQPRIEHGNRFSVTAEYNKVDAYRFTQPADQVDLNLDSQDGLVITLAYARYIDVSVLGDSSSRVDLTGKYESENDRGVVSLTYTNRLFQSLGGSIGISYANHERFLPDSDRVFGAHFGLSFKSFSKDPPKSP